MGRRKNGADEPQAEPADATLEHNVKARKDAIAEALAQLYEIDAQIGEVMAESVKPLREDKAAIKAKLKEDFQITSAIIAARYSSYKLERRARESSDENTLDAIREMFEALPIGGQGSLLPAFEDRGAAMAPD